MKKFLQMQKGVFALLLALFLGSGTAYAYSFYKNCSTGQRLYYNIIDATNHYVEITYPGTSMYDPWGGITKPTGSITLPSTVTYNNVTYTVKAIGDYAFYECDGLTGTLTIPNTVTTIGGDAFNGCSGFTGLTLGNSVTTIGEDAFYGCSGFTGSLTIPNSVTSIGWWAFGSCSGFTGSLTIPDSVTEIGYWAFGWCTGFTGSLTIGNSVTTIDGYAFYQCTGFTGTLTLGNSVTTIGDSAFCGCGGLTGSLTLPDSVTEIGPYAFKGCHGFTGSLVIPNAVASIGSHAFYACDGFTGTLTLGNSVTTIGNWAFAFNHFTGSLTIPNSVTTIGNLAFGYNLGFNGTLTIGTGVTSIGNDAFKSCSGFKGSLTIPNSVIEIGETAFLDCSGFTGDLTIGKHVASIGPDAFSGCTGITHLNYNAINCADFEYLNNEHTPFRAINGTLSIGNEVQRIPECMFYYCTGFTGSLTIPDSVTEIAYSAFNSCYNLNGSLHLGNALTTIGIYAFYSCNFTGSLTIPDSVTEIGYCAFYGFHITGSLTIGRNVNSIDSYNFNCNSATYMTVRAETPPVLEEEVFYAAPSNLLVYVPCGTLNAYQNASGWNAFTNMTAYCDPLTYSVNPDGVSVTVTGHEDGIYATGTLIIPETKTLNGVTYTVTAIAEGAFSGCSGLTGDLVIPNTVTSIGRYAFQSCTGFTGTLTLPNNLTTLDQGAFYLCSGFTGNLNLPNSLTVINKDVFATCSGFTGPLTIPNTVTSIGELAFHNCSGFTGSLTIPDAVTSIGKQAFANCSGFTGPLTIPNAVTTIGIQAFYGCSGFTGPLTIPNAVTTIGDQAFKNCSGLTGTVTIGTGVTSLGWNTFSGCGFTQINYNAANCAGYDRYNTNPFQGLNATLTLGNTVQTIPDLMFSCCPGLTGTLTIPTSVTTIGYGAFYECSGFTGALNIPNSVTSIGESAFIRCSGFNGTLTLPSYLTTIEDRTFRNCSGLIGSLTIPDGVTSIGFEAFLGCSGFTGNLSIGNAVTTIGNYAFSFCYYFTGSLTIPNAVTEIGEAAFQDCSHFTGNLNINGPVTTIGAYAFNYCRGLTGQLTLPSTVTEIGEMAFNFCDLLTSITALPETPPTLGEDAFQNVPTGIPVYVPCGSLNAYQQASGWSSFTNLQCAPWTVTVSITPNGTGAVMGEGEYQNGTQCTVTAIPNNLFLFLHWSKNGVVVSCNPIYTFAVYEDTELEAVFMPVPDGATIIGSGTNTNSNLPSHSYYKYGLSQQIYTTTELGTGFTINSISFFNTGDTETRSYDVYLVHTSKSSFSSNTDWIAVPQSNRVFSGNVTLRTGMWTTIVLETPFTYNGTSNLALVIDDNTGSYTDIPHMACRVYTAPQINQAIYLYSDGTNYIPSSPSTYNGSRLSVKNQIMFNRTGYNINATSADETAGTVSGGGTYGQGDLCQVNATANSGYVFMDWTDQYGTVVSSDAEYSFFVTQNITLTANFISNDDLCNLTFSLNDSYGDGWNGNYLVVDFGNGLSQRLAVPSSNYSATYTLPVANGSHVELSWIKSSWTNECSFEVRYSNDHLICTSDNQVIDANFEFAFDMDCEEMPALWVYLGDGDDCYNEYLPSHSYFNYGLSQQIYTAEEIGAAGNITSIAFYNQEGDGGNNTKTRTYDIYLKPTNKMEFFSDTDWISVSENDKVFSGSVTLVYNKWTTIEFDIPFVYDGTSNLVLVMDDNSGNWTSLPYMLCRTFETPGIQSLYTQNDYTNFDPINPSNYTGTAVNIKNQVYFGFTPSADCWLPMYLTTTDITSNSATLNWTGIQDSYNVRYRTIPSFYEDFETSAAGWTFTSMNAANDIGAGLNAAGICANAAHNVGYGFRFSSFYQTEEDETYDQYLISPQLTVSGELRFYYRKHNYSTESFYVGYSTTGDDIEDDFTWTELALTTSWQEYTQELPADVKYIAFHYFGNYTYYVYLDDISIDENGIPIGNWNSVNNVASTTTVITGLDSSTLYEWQVQGNNTICNDGVTDWSGKDTFTTTCAAFLVDADNPFFENFEGASFAPDCWENFSTGNSRWISSTNYSHSSYYSAYSYYYGDNYLVLPKLELSANASSAQLDFWSYNSYNEYFIAGNNKVVLLDGDDETVLWTALGVTAAWEKTTIDLTPYLGQTITLAFKYSGNYGNDWYVDDVEVSVAPATAVTQTIALTVGWNWISTNIDPDEVDCLAMLEEALGDYGVSIATSDDIAEYLGDGFWLGLEGYQWTNSEMIMVEVSEDCTVTLVGPAVDPSTVSITINPGWNWIGFPVGSEITLEDALADFEPEFGDGIASYEGITEYIGIWTGDFETLEPGHGYMYYSASATPKTLVFPTGAKGPRVLLDNQPGSK